VLTKCVEELTAIKEINILKSRTYRLILNNQTDKLNNIQLIIMIRLHHCSSNFQLTS